LSGIYLTCNSFFEIWAN